MSKRAKRIAKRQRGWIEVNDPCIFFPIERFPKREEIVTGSQLFHLVDLVPVKQSKPKRSRKS